MGLQQRHTITQIPKRTFLFAVIALALIIRLAVVGIFLPQHKYYNYEYGSHDTNMRMYDDHRYIEQAMNLLNGEGFPKSGEQPPFTYDFRRGPLYPLFLSIVFSFNGFNILYALLAQVLVSSLCILFIYPIALRYFNEKTARFSSVFWAVFPPSIFWVLAVLRETLITFLLLASILTLIALARKPGTGRIFLAGSTAGLLLLQDPFAITLIPVFFGFIFLHDLVKTKTDINKNSIKDRVRSFFINLILTIKKDLKNKLYIGLLWVSTVFVSVSPWLYWTYVKLRRPALGTASAFGIWDDWFTYYKFKSIQKQKPEYTITEFDNYMLQLRFEIGKKYIANSYPMIADQTDNETKQRLVSELIFNSDFISDLNSYNSIHTLKLLISDPSLYFGNPIGKTSIIKFFDYWLNFAVTFRNPGVPEISSLYTMTTTTSLVLRIFAVLGLIVSFLLFLIFVRYGASARFIVVVWLTYFAFYNVVKFRAEARYTLPVQPFAIIVISSALPAALQWKRKRL